VGPDEARPGKSLGFHVEAYDGQRYRLPFIKGVG
jgi:hypothetical protein